MNTHPSNRISRKFPVRLGSMARRTATQLAESAVEKVAESYRTSRGRAAVVLQPCGLVMLDAPDQVAPRDLIAVINRKADPDWLADELRDAWALIND